MADALIGLAINLAIALAAYLTGRADGANKVRTEVQAIVSDHLGKQATILHAIDDLSQHHRPANKTHSRHPVAAYRTESGVVWRGGSWPPPQAVVGDRWTDNAGITRKLEPVPQNSTGRTADGYRVQTRWVIV